MIKHQIDACVEQIAGRFVGINILINNAQVVPLSRLLEVNDANFMQSIDSGPLAMLRLMRASACYPYLKGNGAVVNFASSTSVCWDASSYGAYVAIKEVIRDLTRTAACEWRRRHSRQCRRTRMRCRPARKVGSLCDRQMWLRFSTPFRYAAWMIMSRISGGRWRGSKRGDTERELSRSAILTFLAFRNRIP